MTPEEKENALRAQARRCAEEITKAMSVKPKPKWNAVCPTHPSQALREGKADGYQPGEICQCYWPHEWAVWSGIMKLKMYTPSGSVIVETNDVAQFYPDAKSGGELTTIEMVSPTGMHGKVSVKHSFHQVAGALATAWKIDEAKAGAE